MSKEFVAATVFAPSVPKQVKKSNNCGPFMLHNMKLICENPGDFVKRAKSDGLGKERVH